MHTEKANEIALERHLYMQAFLAQFLKEWNVEDSF
jgi:hypothetical protein